MVGSIFAGAFPVSGDVILQAGSTTGKNDKVDSTKSYTCNFGVTSAGAGLNLNQIVRDSDLCDIPSGGVSGRQLLERLAGENIQNERENPAAVHLV
jgi:hypothetical protein